MSRSMVKLLHADQFFPNDDAENLRRLAESLTFVETEYGKEVDNFNLIFPHSEIIFHKVLGERVIVDTTRSGVLRKSNNNEIHYEHFESIEEWCFIVALEPTTINLYYHIDPKDNMGDLSAADVKSAIEKRDLNYKNIFEWKIHTNIHLEQNQCLFIRPWVFHSLQDGLVQYYRLLPDNKRRILVMGLPGSCKNSIAKKIVERLENSVELNSMQQRLEHLDIDFSVDGQMRHCYRMLNLARDSKFGTTVVNMTCPLPQMRQILNADVVVWANDKKESQYKELNEMFIPPLFYDIECYDDSGNTVDSVIKKIFSKRK